MEGGRTTLAEQDTPDFPIYFRIQRRGDTIGVFTSAMVRHSSRTAIRNPGLARLKSEHLCRFVGTRGVQMPITQRSSIR